MGFENGYVDVRVLQNGAICSRLHGMAFQSGTKSWNIRRGKNPLKHFRIKIRSILPFRHLFSRIYSLAMHVCEVSVSKWRGVCHFDAHLLCAFIETGKKQRMCGA